VNAPAKLGLFGLTLLVVFAVAWGGGKLAGPIGPSDAAHTEPGGHGDAHPPAGGAPKVPGGLQVAQEGYRLELAGHTVSTVESVPFAFKVIGPDGKPVTAYTTAHEKDLHLVLVRRDLTGFQHVHPTLGADGLWSVPLKVSAPGPYRVFADFVPAGRAEGLILGADVTAPGDYRPTPLAPPTRTATVGDYTVQLEGELVAGTSSKLTLTVTRAGAPVTDLEPYLGAFGHLVVVRDGDLAYLHVHPQESGSAGPQIVFHTEVPSPGSYGLFLDFQHGGAVHTATFTATTQGVSVPSPSPAGHGDDHGH
jgi:hypothetical protein